jgi:cyclopropane-fatty-acyl-phospholipid synthase
VRKYIFPGHYLPCVSDLALAHEQTGWKIADIEELRQHYAWTLAEWYRRAMLHREQIVKMFDERFFRMWQFYLVGAEQGFRNGTMVNFHVQATKRAGVLPVTRDYIAAEAARLSAAEGTPVWHLEREAAE